MRNDRFLDVTSYKPAKKGRRFVVMLLDYFLVLLVSFSLFALVVQPIFDSTGMTKESEKQYQEKQDEVLSIIVSTHLQKKDDKENLVSVSSESKNYITKLLKFSCSKYPDVTYYELNQGKKDFVEVKEEEKLSYQDKDGYYQNDDILYYYLGFRKKNLTSYQTEIKDMTLADINRDILHFDTDNKDLVSSDFLLNSDVFYLSKENTEIILDYVNYGTESGKTLYQRLSLLYRQAILDAISEVEKSYTPYLEKNEEFKEVYQHYATSLAWMLILSYVIGFLLCYVPFQCIFRHGRTVGYRFFSLASVGTDMMEVRWWQILVKDLVLFITTFSSVFFMPLLLGKIQILSAVLFGPITVFQVVLFSFLMVVLSIVFFLISKDRQTLSEFASLTCTVDLREREEAFLDAQEKEQEKNGK